jgi:hypothetical protein
MVPVTAPATERAAWIRRAGRAGVVAALAMLFAQLLWRLVAGAEGAPSFPETIVAAVARLTPLGLFGWATENLGSLAQNGLFVATLLGILAAGHEAGALAGRWAWAERWGSGERGRWLAGAAVAGLLLLVAVGIVLPLGGYGLSGSESRHGAAILLQSVVTFGLWAVLWPLLAGPAPTEAEAAAPPAGPTLSRRAAVGQGAVGVGALALLGGIGAMTWQLFQPRSTGNAAAGEASARSIEATAAARSAPVNPGGSVAPTTAPLPALAVADEAAAGAGAAAAAPADGLPTFAQLEAEGRLTPRLTPVADFYHVSKNISDPVVSADGWSLTVDGLVDRPQTYTLSQLTERATTKNITTLGCISNELNGDLISTAEWTGISLVELLEGAGCGRRRSTSGSPAPTTTRTRSRSPRRSTPRRSWSSA